MIGLNSNAYWSPYATSGISLYHLYDSDGNTSTYKNFVQRNISYNNQEFIGNIYANGVISDGNGIIIDDTNHAQDTNLIYNGKTLVSNNLVYNNGGSGIHTNLSQHVDIVNNTAYFNNVSTYIVAGQIFAGVSQNINFYNNIMVASPGKAITSNTGNTNVIFDYNVYFGGSGGSGAAVIGPHDLNGVDPQFVSSSAYNFQLQSGSPALLSGTPYLAPNADLLKNPRPGSDGGYDRGAYQR